MQALDSRLDGLMAVVRLQYLVSREGGWGAQAEWGETLSLGEIPETTPSKCSTRLALPCTVSCAAKLTCHAEGRQTLRREM